MKNGNGIFGSGQFVDHLIVIAGINVSRGAALDDLRVLHASS